MKNRVDQVFTFGGARRIVLETMVKLSNDEIDVGRATAIANNMKALNESIQVEINAAKLSFIAEDRGHDFGKFRRMGMKEITNGGDDKDDKDDKDDD